MQQYITTPIYYVNGAPHLGHAYTTIAADVTARYYTMLGHEVKFLTGTDEHGQKVQQAAEVKNISPQDFTDEISQHFRRLVQTGENILGVSNTDFIRTTEPRHKQAAQAFWQALEASGMLYKSTYSGWYATRDECYYQESELIEGKAPTGADVEWVEEDSIFFKLSAFQQPLLDYFATNPDCILPNSRMKEVVSFVRGGLKDLSISRTKLTWGVPVPNEPEHVMYVWVDALTNYLTSCGYPDMQGEMHSQWEQGAPIHFIGKDILRFHAVYWLAMLMAVDLPLPKQIIAGGWWLVEGEKMSKSLGNVLAPDEPIEQFGLDIFRYFLLREIPFGNDGNFSQEALIIRCNAELANNVGNLAQRTLSMIAKQCDHILPQAGEEPQDKTLLALADSQLAPYHEAMQRADFSSALESMLVVARAANEYVDDQAPWVLKKENPTKMAAVLGTLAQTIHAIALMLLPFAPSASQALLAQLGIENNEQHFKGTKPKIGAALPAPQGVFPRMQIFKVPSE